MDLAGGLVVRSLHIAINANAPQLCRVQGNPGYMRERKKERERESGKRLGVYVIIYVH